MQALNVDFEGNGLPDLSQSAVQDGIVVETPVQAHVQVGAGKAGHDSPRSASVLAATHEDNVQRIQREERCDPRDDHGLLPEAPRKGW